MIPLAWKWLRRNFNLVLLLSATVCLVLALGKVIRGVTWSWLMPVSLLAVACGWGIGSNRLTPKQAWVCLTAWGIPGVFIYVGGLVRPLGSLILSIFALIPQIVAWLSDRSLIDTGPLLVVWDELTGHIGSLLIRLWEWSAALFAGRPIVDPLAAGVIWNILLWLIGAWAGWRLRRSRQALQALAPGGIMLALVLDYSHREVELLIVYLAILLVLVGLASLEWMHLGWEQRKVEYSESIRIDTLAMVGMITIALVLSAAGAPSLSWRELVEKLRGTDRAAEDRAAEALGLERPVNVANSAAYRSDGLPRGHLLSMPPELLQDVVMTISTGKLPPIPETVININPNRYHWRAITFDVYSGIGWSSSVAQDIPLSANTSLLEFPTDYRVLNQHIKREPNQNQYVYWVGILAQVDADIEIAWRTKPPKDPNPAHYGDMLGALTEPDEYNVVSYVPQYSLDQLRTAGSDYPSEIARRYLGLPNSTPDRVLALARELTQAAPTPYDRAVAIESYLRTFPYTLEVEPPPRGHDIVDYFLFTARQGYCDYYATSMVVLARAAGLPARLVVGYANGDYQSPTAEYIVRQKHAHSWAEVYFSDIGWVEFEPTASQPSIIRTRDESASGLSQNLPGANPAITWLKTSWRGLISSLVGQIAITGAGMILLFSLWQAGEFGFLHLIPSKMAILRMYALMVKASARLLPDLPDGNTPYQLQLALIDKLKGGQNPLIKTVFSAGVGEIERMVALYVAQVFSQNPPAKSQVGQGIKAWLRLRWRLWVAKIWLR